MALVLDLTVSCSLGCFAGEIVSKVLFSANLFGALVTITSYLFSLLSGFTPQCQAETINQPILGMTCKDKYN